MQGKQKRSRPVESNWRYQYLKSRYGDNWDDYSYRKKLKLMEDQILNKNASKTYKSSSVKNQGLTDQVFSDGEIFEDGGEQYYYTSQNGDLSEGEIVDEERVQNQLCRSSDLQLRSDRELVVSEKANSQQDKHNGRSIQQVRRQQKWKQLQNGTQKNMSSKDTKHLQKNIQSSPEKQTPQQKTEKSTSPKNVKQQAEQLQKSGNHSKTAVQNQSNKEDNQKSLEPKTPKKNVQNEKQQQSWQLKKSNRPRGNLGYNASSQQKQSKIKSVSLNQPGRIRSLLNEMTCSKMKEMVRVSSFDRALVNSGGGKITTAEDQEKWMQADRTSNAPLQAVPLNWHSSTPELKSLTQARKPNLPKRGPNHPQSLSKQRHYSTIPSNYQTAQKPQQESQAVGHQKSSEFPTLIQPQEKIQVLENTQQQQHQEMQDMDQDRDMDIDRSDQDQILSKIHPKFLEWRTSEEEVRLVQELRISFYKRAMEINYEMRQKGLTNGRGNLQGVNAAYKEKRYNDEFRSRCSVYGHPRGVAIGDSFENRQDMAICGVHGSLWKGIYGPGQGKGSSINGAASAICLSGGYADDQDQGDVIEYTGEGGRDKNIQLYDQTMDGGNLALIRSYENYIPIKVSRKIGEKYYYEGLYFVEKYVYQESGQTVDTAKLHQAQSAAIQKDKKKTISERPKVYIFTLKGVPGHCRTSGKVLGQGAHSLNAKLNLKQPSSIRERIKSHQPKDFQELVKLGSTVNQTPENSGLVCQNNNLNGQQKESDNSSQRDFDEEDFANQLEQCIDMEEPAEMDVEEGGEPQHARNAEDDLHFEFLHQLELNGKIKILQNDISWGKENVRIPLIVDSRWLKQGFKIRIPEFKYITDYDDDNFSADAKQILMEFLNEGQEGCGLQHRKLSQSFYNEEGLLKCMEFAGVFECPENCRNFAKQCEYNNISLKGVKLPLEVRFIDQTRKFGVTCGRDISSGEFICCYMGEVLTEFEADELEKKRPEQKPSYLFYLQHYIDLYLRDDVSEECKQQLLPVSEEFLAENNHRPCIVLNGKKEGNISRFLNHSCDPNLVVQTVIREGTHGLFYYVCFFAQQDILAGEELTFNYTNKGRVVVADKPCLCGADECRGWVT